MRALPTTHTGWLAGDARRKTTPVPSVRAPCARARRSRAVFRLPVGAARHAKAAVPPRTHSQYGSGDSPAEALRPRRGDWRDAVHPSVYPWQGAADFGRRPTGGGAGVKGAQLLAPFFGDFLWRKESHSPSVDSRQAPPLNERKIQDRRRSTYRQAPDPRVEISNRPGAGPGSFAAC